jgi:hypothetical protein
MAPPGQVLYIPKPVTITYYSSDFYGPLMDAIYQWESCSNPLAFNLVENAVGGFQIRQCRIDHYNNLNGTNYTLEDCYDLELSKKVFLYFTVHDSAGNPIPRKSWEQTAKDWNGSGPMTEIYWENVKNLI